MSSIFSQEAMEIPLGMRESLLKREKRKDPQHLSGKYISAIPLEVVQEIEAKRAGHALALVLVLHRQMTMEDDTRSLVLTNKVWQQLGDVDPNRRQVLLRNLKKVPRVFTLTSSRAYLHHYRVTRGPLWPKGGPAG
jgi:hypothetical protein